MVFRLYNTLTRQKQDFAPIDAGNVRMYVCGPTVYDRAHIGNARPEIVFDVLFRLLRHLYGPDHVRYVRNITDVDDKIIARAVERDVSIADLTEVTAREFAEDVDALGCLRPTVEPRATDHIPEMVALIERLIASGHAYAASSHVLFDVPSMPTYGGLSRRPLDEMIAGARVEVAPYKRSDADFVLWKPSTEHEPGWPSPWGRGRPGWHIECSAMSWKHLGETFDIHGGGIDLIFPHHENEVAQSCCAFDRDAMANVWLHNGFLQVDGRKMSKSLGNFVTIRDLLAGDGFGGRSWPGEVLRLAMLRTHYRQPIDWTVQALEEAERTLDRWYSLVSRQDLDDSAEPWPKFIDHLSDDLNTPAAITELHSLFSSSRAGEMEAGNSALGWDIDDVEDASIARASARMFGLLEDDPEVWQAKREGRLGIDRGQVDAMITDRLAARAAKNWAESDRLRDALTALGVALKDNKDGTTTWSVASKGSRVMAAPPVALRPMLPTDVPVLAALFRASVATLTEDDYDDDQREAWATSAEDEAAFGRKLAACLTLIATLGGETAGFASLEGKDKVTMLYVAPEFARQGVATALVDALIKLATARGAAKLTVDASDTARDLFAKRGFIPMVRNMVPVGGEWLGNTTMERQLAAAEQDT